MEICLKKIVPQIVDSNGNGEHSAWWGVEGGFPPKGGLGGGLVTALISLSF